MTRTGRRMTRTGRGFECLSGAFPTFGRHVVTGRALPALQMYPTGPGPEHDPLAQHMIVVVQMLLRPMLVCAKVGPTNENVSTTAIAADLCIGPPLKHL